MISCLNKYVLTHCILVDLSTIICWTSPFVILGCRVYVVGSILFLMETYANKVDADQTPHYVASGPGLRCLHMALLRVPGKNGLKGGGTLKQPTFY